MGRWISLLLQVFGWLLGGLLVLVFVAFVWLTATSSGTRWWVGQAEQRVSGLSVGETKGNLWQGLSLNQLAFDGADGLSLSLGKAYVQLDWRQFWHFSLQIKKLSVDDVILRLPPPSENPEPPAAPLNLADLPLSLPIGIHVLDLEVNRFTLLQSEHDIQGPNPIPKPSFSLTTLRAEGLANRYAISLKIKQFSAVLPNTSTPDSAVQEDTTIDEHGALTVAVASPHRVRGAVSGLVSLPQGWLTTHVTLGGSLADVQAGLAARWDGFASPSASLSAHAQINTQRVQLNTLSVDALNGILCGNAAVNYADGLQVSVHGEAKGLNPAAIDPSMAGQVGFHYQMAFVQPAAASDGVSAPHLSFGMTELTGQIAQVPFKALAVQGTMADQHIDATISEGTLAGGALRVKGQMGLSEPRPVSFSLDLEHAALNDLSAQAGVSAQGPFSTHLNLAGTLGADPARDASLDFSWSVPATVMNLPAPQGQTAAVRVPLALAVHGGIASQRLTLKQARIDIADASVDAKGDLAWGDATPASTLALVLGMKIPELSHLPWRALDLPDLAGAVDLKAQLSGSLQQPKGRVNLAAHNLVYQQWHLAGLSLDGHLNADKASGFDIRLLADRLTQADARTAAKLWLNQVRINAQGQWPQLQSVREEAGRTAKGGAEATSSSAAQRLTLSAHGPLGHLDLAADGAMSSQGESAGQNPRWRGRLTRLDLAPADIDGQPFSPWRLQNPAPLVLSAQEQRLGETCLTPDTLKSTKGSHFCLGADHTTDGRGDAHLDVDLPLALIKRWLPSNGNLPGRVTLVANAAAQSGQVSGSLKLALPDNEFRLPDLLGDRVYHYKNVGLMANLKSGVVSLNVQADVPQLLTAKGGGTLMLPGQQTGPQAEHSALALRGDVQLPDVSVLQNLLPQVEQLNGRAEASVTVGGTLQQPKPSGRLVVDQLAFTLPDTGVAYDQGKLDARIDGAGQLVFSGGLTGTISKTPSGTKPVKRTASPSASKAAATAPAGDQRIKIQGTGNLARLPAWQVRVTVQGQAVPVLRLPSLVVDASPDITVDATEAGATIGGTITLPTVTARVEKLPEGVVKSSDDLVIVGEQKVDRTDAYPLTGDITLKLGKAVSLAGMGFSTDLSGQLDLQLRPNKPLAALGEINLINGVYKAYGQNLSISSGRLMFVGPVNDPGLAATAQRVVGTTTVGLRISGTLYHPQTTVFSSPSMPESDALSMLLTGRPLSDSGSGDRAMLMNAIAGLGVAQGNDIVRDIGQKFGFDSVGLDTSGGLGDTRLSLGKQIGARLFVRYAVGVLNGVSEIITQYKLSKLFSIEITASPEATGGDLIYRIH
jgi:translocation and assembly module TamB